MKKVLTEVVLLVICFLMHSCEKDLANQGNRPHEDNFQSLNVPSTFDWVTSKNIVCTVNSAESTIVEIYADEACQDELLATFITKQGSNQLSMSVAQPTNQLYLKYNTASGASKVLTGELTNGSVIFSVDNGIQTQKAESRDAKTRGVPVEDHGAYITYPAGWGTVMFEDLFPAIGDYDLNDFVASYQISIEFPYIYEASGYDIKHANLVRVHLRLKAIGGSLSFIPYVRIVGLNKNNVSMPNPPYGDAEHYVNPDIKNNTTDGVEVSFVNSLLTDDVIIEFKNLNATNPKAVLGVPFFNTTQGKTMKDKDLTEVVVYLELNDVVESASLLDDKIDIFLASEDKSKEIHVRGFESAFTPYDFTVEGVNKEVPYASDKNLVWGIKIAKTIQHAVEKADFCNAYHDFASWATSGGVLNTDWYNTNKEEDNLIRWAK